MKKYLFILPLFACTLACAMNNGKKNSYKTPEPVFDANYFVSDEEFETLPEPILPSEAGFLTAEQENSMNLISVDKYVSYQSYGEYGSDDEWGIFVVPVDKIGKYNDQLITTDEDDSGIIVSKPCINNYFGTIVKINKNGKESAAARGFVIKGIKNTECDEPGYKGPAYILLVKPGKDSLEMDGMTEELSEFVMGSLK